LYGKIKKLHFVGIGGIGMSGIAEILINMGYEVSGSDIRTSDTVKRLRELGATIHLGHKEDNVQGTDVVVISAAIKDDNPEVAEAQELNIPVIPRAQMLAELMRLRYGIAVAGSHGKTTTTSLISAVLSHGGLDPTIVVGGKVKTLGTNARLGKGNFMVVEADESDGSFLLLSPVISVLTNIDEEHMDYYKTIGELQAAFEAFLNKIPFYGVAVLCVDCPRVRVIASKFDKKFLTYGFGPEAELRAEDVVLDGMSSRFNVVLRGTPLGSVQLGVPGRHNALNALAAIAVGMELGMSFGAVRDGLAEFKGIDRRLQIKGRANDVLVVDDYAHHPKEISVTIEALRNSMPGRLVVIFQPHRYSRTQHLYNEFVASLQNIDKLFVMDIYPAGEKPIPGISSGALSESIKKAGNKNVVYLNGDADQITTVISSELKPNDIVLTLGAGNVWAVGEKLLGEIV